MRTASVFTLYHGVKIAGTPQTAVPDNGLCCS